MPSGRVSGLGDHHEKDERWGLSVEQRKQAFLDLMDAERKAERESVKKFADAPQSDDAKRFETQQAQKYKAEVGKKYGLDGKQLVELSAEGFRKRWPVQGKGKAERIPF